MLLDLDLRTLTLTCDSSAVEAKSAAPAESGLIERFGAGDREAFTTLYRRHYAEIARFAMYMTGDQSKAEELSHDVFVWLIDHPRAFQSELGTFPAFLKGVARNLLRRHWRNQRRWQSLDEMILRQPAAKELIAAGKELSTGVDAAVLRKAIARLPLKYREAIVLCDLEGDSYEEAAVVMRCPVGTIRSRLHRARRLLAEQFEPHHRSQR
jgi:RNA polymerase sigma-70 factor, ECF subfamily